MALADCHQPLSRKRMNLRNATEKDVSRISEIYLAARKHILSYAPLAHTDEQVRAWVRDSLVPAGGVTVAESEEGVLGFLAVSREGAHGWIDQLYLDSSAMGLGFGGRLMERAKQSLGAPIRLYTFQQNVDARRFYERHGFCVIAHSDGSTNEEKTPDFLMEWTG
jgi:ribosomal protein S18 acetylase RimI-like enzyme